jgi:hypothetical protein
MRKQLSDNPNDMNFESMRLLYYRLSATILCKSYTSIDGQLINKFMMTLNNLIQHSRYVDNLDVVLKHHTSLASLYFYKQDIYNTYKTLLQNASLTTGTGTGTGSGAAAEQLNNTDMDVMQCSLSYIRIFHDAIQNLHRLYPDEQATIGAESKAYVDAIMKRYIAYIERLIHELIYAYTALDKQFDVSNVLNRMLPSTASTTTA